MMVNPLSTGRFLLPGMVRGAPRRNALVLIGYLLGSLTAAWLLAGSL